MKRVLIAALALLCAMPLAARAQGAAGPVYEQPLSAQAVRDVQVRLRQLGYYAGPIDGIWGQGTSAAVARFQQNRRLAATGELNQATVSALGLDPSRLVSRGYAPRAEIAPARIGPQTTRAVQHQLRHAGFYGGPIDGVWGPNTRAAMAAYQRRNGFAVTGEPDRDTLIALGLRPEQFMSGSSVPPANAAQLNRSELERMERTGRY
jgi:peptidoglycan hydrolase-like protein with peptidoglycan-binding domain